MIIIKNYIIQKTIKKGKIIPEKMQQTRKKSKSSGKPLFFINFLHTIFVLKFERNEKK